MEENRGKCQEGGSRNEKNVNVSESEIYRIMAELMKMNPTT